MFALEQPLALSSRKGQGETRSKEIQRWKDHAKVFTTDLTDRLSADKNNVRSYLLACHKVKLFRMRLVSSISFKLAAESASASLLPHTELLRGCPQTWRFNLRQYFLSSIFALLMAGVHSFVHVPISLA